MVEAVDVEHPEVRAAARTRAVATRAARARGAAADRVAGVAGVAEL